jgi:NTP pyrophosphatase (non-canonical NTP hydrolase)
MGNNQLKEITDKVEKKMKQYQDEFSDVKVDRDYFPFKVTEEWGECLQAYLMLTNRGRQKGKSKDEIKEMLTEEFADVFAFLLLFAHYEGIDPVEALNKKWFRNLKE